MKNVALKILFPCLIVLASSFAASAQEPEKQKSAEEYAYDETERLRKMLDLGPNQTFYVDSILQHDFKCMMDELKKHQEAGVQDINIYNKVRKDWYEKIEAAYEKIFTDDQMYEYRLSRGQVKKDKARSKAIAERKKQARKEAKLEGEF
ncbi:MAG: hypothetical protein HUJ89_00695 [Bacteroidales bacterium]|nr:hypothetical protein [Bacteroidales bacterium]